mmetsp:Transcript_20298/g.29361  ORF Transcript_20298/g.29361 Transcript_20298/m.29361 type:complete len:205 (+) Transcript_20298:311-925(+)
MALFFFVKLACLGFAKQLFTLIVLLLIHSKPTLPHIFNTVAQIPVIHSIRQRGRNLKTLFSIQPLHKIECSLQLSGLNRRMEQLDSHLINLSRKLRILVFQFFHIVTVRSNHIGRESLLCQRITSSDAQFFHTKIQRARGKRNTQAQHRRYGAAGSIRVLISSLQWHAHKFTVLHRNRPEHVLRGLTQTNRVQNWIPVPCETVL